MSEITPAEQDTLLSMASVCKSNDASESEKESAFDTIHELLFPTPPIVLDEKQSEEFRKLCQPTKRNQAVARLEEAARKLLETKHRDQLIELRAALAEYERVKG